MPVNNCIHRDVCRFSKRIKSGACASYDFGGCEFYVPDNEPTPFIHPENVRQWLLLHSDNNTVRDWDYNSEIVKGFCLEDIINESFGLSNDDDDEDAIGSSNMDDWGI